MMAVSLYLIIILVVGAVVAAVEILAYNRRVNRVAKGEIRDRHSAIPAPATTVNGVYKAVLLVVVVLALLNISALQGKLADMQHSINNLQSAESELYALRELVEQSGRRVAYTAFEFSDMDYAARTGKIHLTAGLKEYSEDTSVTLRVGGQSVELEKVAPGIYETTFVADLFAPYTEAALHIGDGGRTTVEALHDFPQWVFMEYLPMPCVMSRLSSYSTLGKMKCEGGYTVWTDHPNDVASVSLTYMTGGQDIAALDITEKTLEVEEIPLEKGLRLDRDLTFRIEILTKSGFRIVQQELMCGDTGLPGVEGFVRIEDLGGNVLWKME